jgi:hypothetical protein
MVKTARLESIAATPALLQAELAGRLEAAGALVEHGLLTRLGSSSPATATSRDRFAIA